MRGQACFPNLLNTPENKDVDEWTFNGASTRDFTHCYHDYPARMIPQVARKLLDLFSKDANILFDPYCGTGTSLVEGMRRGLDVVGTDLNPVARLIATAKTSLPNLTALQREIASFIRLVYFEQDFKPADSEFLYKYKNINFWFKSDVIAKLLKIKGYIDQISESDVRNFFLVAFSETARESSNTKNNEFKLFRMKPAELDRHNPDVFNIMLYKLNRNLEGLRQFSKSFESLSYVPSAIISDFNTVLSIPSSILTPECVDIVITSPPYGDSHTTVAYGQFSRLSAEWLEFSDAGCIDKHLMGGIKPIQLRDTGSKIINLAIQKVNESDPNRAREVFGFYSELESSIVNIAKVVRQDGYVCYVVGNRTVKGVRLPTDIAVMEFYQNLGFEHIRTFTRSIPNKRMPARNSPTNVPGLLEETMTKEYVVVMQKK